MAFNWRQKFILKRVATEQWQRLFVHCLSVFFLSIFMLFQHSVTACGLEQVRLYCGTEIIKDNDSNLSWTETLAENVSWQQARDYCANLTVGNYDDWYLPWAEQFETLLDHCSTTLSERFPHLSPSGARGVWTQDVITKTWNGQVWEEAKYLHKEGIIRTAELDPSSLNNVLCVRNGLIDPNQQCPKSESNVDPTLPPSGVNSAPIVTIVKAPATTRVGKTYIITLDFSDSDNNIAEVYIDWRSLGNPEVVSVSPKGGTFAFEHDYSKRGTFTWTAYAVDSAGKQSYPVYQRVEVGPAPLTGTGASSQLRYSDTAQRNSDAYQYICSCSTGQCKTINYVNDPIDSATGGQVLVENLLTVNGAVPLSFTLRYNSLLLAEGIVGKAWETDKFDTRIEELANGDVEVHWSANRSNIFKKTADGQYSSEALKTLFDHLIKNEQGHFTLTCHNRLGYEFDTSGYLAKLTNAQNQAIAFTRDGNGRLTQASEPVSGVALNYTYNSAGLLETVSDPLGRTVRLEYEGNLLTKLIDPENQSTQYTYNEAGQIVKAEDAQGPIFINIFDEEGRIIEQDDGITTNQPFRLKYEEQAEPPQITTTTTDRNGQQRVYVYDGDYQLLNLKDELGYETRFTYENGRRMSMTDPKNRTTQYVYAQGHLTAEIAPENRITTFMRDEMGNITTIEDPQHKKVTFTYENNRMTSMTNPLGQTSQRMYNAEGQVSEVIAPSGATTHFEYTHGQISRVTDAGGHTQELRYDAAGRVIEIRNAEGQVTVLKWDHLDRIVEIIDPLQRTVKMTYDRRGHVETVTDAMGRVTRFEYDANGNKTKVINALGQITRYEYEGEDRLQRVIDAKGRVVATVDYDAKGRAQKVTDALGRSQQIRYDETNNVIEQVDALNQAVRLTYDTRDQLETITDALNQVVTLAYDEAGQLTAIADALNKVTTFKYDGLYRLDGSLDALKGESTQTFDVDGLLSSLTDPNGQSTTFTRTVEGQVAAEQTAGGKPVQYRYNARDLVDQVTNGRGQVLSLVYDAGGRISSWSDAEGVTTSVTYDANDNVLTLSNAQGVITYTYDELNRVKTYTDVYGNTVQYAYDDVGHLVTLTYPDGKPVGYRYDAASQLVQVTDWNGRVTRYEYDLNGRRTQEIRPNGTQSQWRYNEIGQLVSAVDTDAAGRPIVEVQFSYDPAGNIVKEEVQPQPALFTSSPVSMGYGPGNQLATVNGQAVTFDADENLVQGPLSGEWVAFVFDSHNRLQQVGATTYRYDAQDTLIATVINGEETRFVVNPLPTLSQVLVRQKADGTQTFYVYGLGLIGEETNGVYQAYHFDLRGSTVALSNATGQVVDRFQYSPFGALVNRSPAMVATPFLYNGRDGVMTEANGLYYMRARFYHPELRRFVNRDPVMLGSVVNGQSLNRFAFVEGRPVNHIDSLGLQSFDFDPYSSEQVPMQYIGSYAEDTFFPDERLAMDALYNIDSDPMQFAREIEKGSVDSLELFRSHYRYGLGNPVNINVEDLWYKYESLRKLRVSDFSNPIRTNEYGDPEIDIKLDDLIYGNVAVALDPYDRIYIKDELYDFDYKEGKNFFEYLYYLPRNTFTIISKTYHGAGTPFLTHFEGYIEPCSR